LGLDRLGAADFAAIETVQGHVLRLEGCHPQTTAHERAAQPRYQRALARIRGGALGSSRCTRSSGLLCPALLDPGTAVPGPNSYPKAGVGISGAGQARSLLTPCSWQSAVGLSLPGATTPLR
jgi:hypothetical protein